MATNGASNREDILACLNQLLIDTNGQIRRTHQLMDRVRQHISKNMDQGEHNQEDGWRISL